MVLILSMTYCLNVISFTSGTRGAVLLVSIGSPWRNFNIDPLYNIAYIIIIFQLYFNYISTSRFKSTRKYRLLRRFAHDWPQLVSALSKIGSDLEIKIEEILFEELLLAAKGMR